MDPPEKPGKTSAFVKVALGLMITAITDVVVSFSTAYWATWRDPQQRLHGGYGLWKMWRCNLEEDADHDAKEFMDIHGFGPDESHESMGCNIKMADNTFPAWYVASQVLQTLGLAGLVTCTVLVFVFIFVPRWYASEKLIRIIVALAYLTGVFTGVSLFVFGFKVAEEIQDLGAKDWALSWSFSLSCTACLLTKIAASVLITEYKRLHALSTDPLGVSKRGYGDILPVAVQDDELLNNGLEYFEENVKEIPQEVLSGIVTTA